MIQIFKIFTSLDKYEPNKLFSVNQENVTRGHKFKINKKRCNTKIRKNFFSYRAIDQWNKLPNAIIESDSLNTFKNRLDKHWEGKECKFTPSFF